MLKWILAVLFVGLFCVGIACADEDTKSLSGGFFYDIDDCHIDAVVNATLVPLGAGFSFDMFGKREDNKSDTVFGEVFGVAVTYDIKSLIKWVKIPDWIDLKTGYAVSVNQLLNRDSEFHHGIKADIVKLTIKF